MPLPLAQRFGQVAGIFLKSFMARERPPETEEPEPEKKSQAQVRKSNSTKAVKSRKAKYGSSKMKRKTVKDKREDGDEVEDSR